MKRKWLVAVLLLVVFALTACGGKEPVDTEELDNATEKIKSLKKELQEAQETLKTKTDEKEKVQKELDEIKEVLGSTEEKLKETEESLDGLKKEFEESRKDFAAYKEKMSAYENLSETEKQAREAEARMTIQKEEEERRKKEEAEAAAKKKEEEEKRKEEEKRQKEEEEKAKKGYNTGITYDQLARTPDKYKNEKVKFTGKILQVLEGDSVNEMRLSVHKDGYGYYDSDQVIYCVYSPKLVDYRLLEDDIITIYGVAQGIISYKAVMGNTITIPLVYVDKIEKK